MKDEIIYTRCDDDGVIAVTVGNAAAIRLKRIVVELLRFLDNEGYRIYRRAKRPSGPDSEPTDESRREAIRLAFERAQAFVLAHYVHFEEE